MGARILIIDDDPSLLTAFTRYLGRAHTIEVANTGPEALARLSQGEHYDLILCDLMMPEMSGIELYDELLVRHPHQARRVVFMTGGDYRAPLKDFYDEVPLRCLEKPVELEKLSALVELAARNALPRYSRESNGD